MRGTDQTQNHKIYFSRSSFLDKPDTPYHRPSVCVQVRGCSCRISTKSLHIFTPKTNPAPTGTAPQNSLFSYCQAQVYFLSLRICLLCISNCVVHGSFPFAYHMVSSLSCGSMYQVLHPFYWQIIFHHMDIPHFNNPFITWRTRGVVSTSGLWRSMCQGPFKSKFMWTHVLFLLGK